MDLFNDELEPVFNSDAGVKALETILALQKNAAEGVAGWGWGENRAAWLGGQLASNISWQDCGTQATRPDQSKIVGDVLTIYEPRVEGGRFAPPNIAGSTSVVTATSKNPEGAFLMLAFLTTASIMAMNEANANGVAPGYRSVLNNPNLRQGLAAGRRSGRPSSTTPGARRAFPACSRWSRCSATRSTRRARRPDHAEGGARCRRQAPGGRSWTRTASISSSRPSTSPLSPADGSAKARRCRSDGETRRPCHGSGGGTGGPEVARRTLKRRSPAMRKAMPYLLVAPAVIYLAGDHALSRHLSRSIRAFSGVKFNKLDLCRARELPEAPVRPRVLGEPLEHLRHRRDRRWCSNSSSRWRSRSSPIAIRGSAAGASSSCCRCCSCRRRSSFIWKLAFNDGRVVSDLLMRLGLDRRGRSTSSAMSGWRACR